MASLYWVGGTATWDNLPLLKWATSSGGVGGASIPTSADNVFFDANSGASTITTSASSVCNNITLGGFTGTITLGTDFQVSGDFDATSMTGTFSCSSFALSTNGSFTLGSGMTLSSTGDFSMTGSASGKTITTAGKTLSDLFINGTGAWTLQDNLTLTSVLGLTKGTLDTGNKNISCTSFSSSNSNIRTLTMGSSTITLTSTGTIWTMATSTNLTLNKGTSTIAITNTSSSNKTFAGGGLTYYNLSITAVGTGIVIFTGANTFNAVTCGAPKKMRFPASTTTTITTAMSWTGSSGNLITIDSSSAGTAATLSVASGTVSCDWLSLKDSTGTGGAAFYAGANSTNVSGNTGWTFTAPPAASITNPFYYRMLGNSGSGANV